jgi:hypothetical protein
MKAKDPVNLLLYTYVIAIIAFILISMFLSGCSPAARIARKDDSAVQRVLAKKDLLDKAYAEAAKNRPCKDSILKYLPGKTDSIYLGEYDVMPEQDEAALIKKIADSITFSYSEDYREGMRQAAQAGYDEAEAKWKRKKIPLPTVDTVWFEDGRKIDGWRTENQLLKQDKAALEAVVKSMKEADKGKIKIPWWLLLLLSATLFGTGFITSKLSK